MNRDDLLQELNKEQRLAVESHEPRILCLAGAGTGKTKTLTSRIARLCIDGVAPDEILALTFTRAAAAEMKERLVAMVGEPAKNVYMGTFHAWAVKVIRQYAFQIGYTPSFTIYDEDDKKDVVSAVIEELQYRVKPEDVLEAMNKETVYNVPIVDEEIKSIVTEYRFRLRKNNAIDLDGLIAGLQSILKKTDIQNLIRRQWPYIFVDEFQDTDHRQMDILTAIDPQNLFVVGDDFQSIYKFRGADVSIIMDMAENPEYEVIKLEENYRSCKEIVDAANRLIKHNNQTEKVLKSHRKGEFPFLTYCVDYEDEMQIIINLIRDRRAGACANYPWNKDIDTEAEHECKYRDIAILGRTNKQIDAIAEALREADIPCQVKTTASDVLMSNDAKKLFTWMNVAFNPRDDASLANILNWPDKTINKMDCLQVEMFQLENSCSFYVALAATGMAKRFFEIHDGIKEKVSEDYDEDEQPTALDMLNYVIDCTGIEKQYRDKGLHTRYKAIQQIKETVASWQEARAEMGEPYTSTDWLDYYAMRNIEGERIEEEQQDAVQVMTAHGSKGLEFDTVIIAGCNQKNFPMTRGDIEEERRLFYVAETRAKNHLYLTRAGKRIVWGDHEEEAEESIFWKEMNGI